VLLAYTGVVWKDVLVSHLAGFAYVCLYVAGRQSQEGRRNTLVTVAIVSFAISAALRQHALILVIPGAVCAAILIARTRAMRIGLASFFIAAIIGFNIAVVFFADSISTGTIIPRTEAGFRTLANFDLTGIVANGGTIPDAAIAAQIQRERAPFYTPLRNDVIPSPIVESPLGGIETPALLALWTKSILDSPRAYFLHRAAHFGGLLWGYRSEPLCDSIFTGVVSSLYIPILGRDIVPELRLEPRSDIRDRRFDRFQHRLLTFTLSFNHAFWALVLIVAAIVLHRRGKATALVLLAASAGVFAVGFGVIGIACEFRYIYILPVTATLLLFVIAIEARPSRDSPAAIQESQVPRPLPK